MKIIIRIFPHQMSKMLIRHPFENLSKICTIVHTLWLFFDLPYCSPTSLAASSVPRVPPAPPCSATWRHAQQWCRHTHLATDATWSVSDSFIALTLIHFNSILLQEFFFTWGLQRSGRSHLKGQGANGSGPVAMKIWTTEHVFNYSWETVTKSQLQKHPNPLQPAVLATDVISRRVDSASGILHSHRIISSDWGLAQWVQVSEDKKYLR